ncbi:CvfB family protein [Roseburia sp. 499]|uniref:CvfB family protein n=1 Tax=Roseburia sp. 499 TaxID=1261634 RepID=UPI000951F740|nr:S1-like domain-containing RNA-binding protein [Roseburia sp. 499]WVK71562.1 S1-like domain-containing RNA-binding protein [Roseburia sp. 499]
MRLGEKQELTVVKKVEFGVYLAEAAGAEERVLLPGKRVPVGIKEGDKIEVFVYKDSRDRIIATTAEPKIKMGEYAVLRVVSVQKIGAFLDWGLEKDLFLPYKEQSVKVREGDEILVRLYIDKSSRLCASMRGLYEMLSTDSPYEGGETVQGRVYEFSNNFGAFIAVDDKYSALLPKHEDHSYLRIGEVVEAKIVEVKPDGKLTLTMRDKAYLQMEEDAKHVLEILDQYAGVLPFTDKASPEIIMRETQMSKNAFKRAVGRLYREHKIEIVNHCIRKK